MKADKTRTGVRSTSNKIKKIIRYVIFALISNVLYGLLLYFVFTWLAGYSILYGYFGNLMLIIIGLVWDEQNHKLWQSEKLLTEIQANTLDATLGKQMLRLYLDAFTSFKTILYLFYIFILVFSQIIDFIPTLVNENIANFISANTYSILLLIAVDQLIGQFSKDRERMKRISAKLEKYLTENKEEQLNQTTNRPART